MLAYMRYAYYILLLSKKQDSFCISFSLFFVSFSSFFSMFLYMPFISLLCRQITAFAFASVISLLLLLACLYGLDRRVKMDSVYGVDMIFRFCLTWQKIYRIYMVFKKIYIFCMQILHVIRCASHLFQILHYVFQPWTISGHVLKCLFCVKITA
jgi:hypothetical protein